MRCHALVDTVLLLEGSTDLNISSPCLESQDHCFGFKCCFESLENVEKLGLLVFLNECIRVSGTENDKENKQQER